MKKTDSGLITGRDGQRLTTQKQQREAKGKGFHPRGLARAVVHSQLKTSGATGVNKPGMSVNSNFAKHWRDEAAAIFGK